MTSSSIKLRILLCFALFHFESLAVESLAGDEHRAETNIRTCGIIGAEHHLMEGKLSDYWAQELIGADLLKEELEGRAAPSQANFIFVFDGSRRDHSHNVRNLISGKGPQAVLPELEDKISLSELEFDGNYFFPDPFFHIRENIPSFINHSMVLGNNERYYEGFKRWSPPAVVAVSAGNDFPEPLDKTDSQASLDFNAILVGSLSPFGLVSEFSQEGEEVHILAPSDNYITSADSKGAYSQFGGTSGAAPLVTGALAGFEWISGYHPTAEEVKILLEKTAISTLHSHERPRLNGAGVLNAYKISRLAVRLSEMCQSNDCFRREIRRDENYLFPEDTSLKEDLARAFPSCSFERALSEETNGLNQLLSGPQIEEMGMDGFHRFNPAFDRILSEETNGLNQFLSGFQAEESGADDFHRFDPAFDRILSEETDGLNQLLSGPQIEEMGMDGFHRFNPAFEQAPIEEAERNFRRQSELSLPFVEQIPAETSCEEKAQTLKNLRREYLLSPDRRELLESLSCIYREAGFEQNALMMDSLALALEPVLKRSVLDPPFALYELVRHRLEPSLKAGLSPLSFLMEQSKGRPHYKAVIRLIGNIAGEEGLALLNQPAQDEDYEVRIATALAVGKIGGEGGSAVLERLAKDEDYEVRIAVARTAGRIGGKEGLALLERLAQDENHLVKEAVAEAAGKIGGDGGFALLERLSRLNERAYVRAAVAWAMRQLKEPRSLALLHKLIQDEAYLVRETVARTAGHIGGEEGLALLQKLTQDESFWVKIAVAFAAGHIGGEEGFALLQELAQDKSRDVRSAVVWAARRLRRDKSLALLKQLMQDKDPLVREDIALAAGHIGGEGGFALLRELTQDKDPKVRIVVVQAVGQMRGEEGFALLWELAQDKEPDEVKVAVAQVAGQIGGELGTALLRKLARDKSLDVRSAVLWAASQLKRENSLAVLSQIALDKAPVWFGEAVARAIERMEGQGHP